MTEITYIAGLMDAIVMPLLALVALLLAKFTQGDGAKFAQRQFLAALVVMTIVTLRTVIRCDEMWLVHTTTLAGMIVGALVIPNANTSVAV